jgi:hypothetical protein
MLRAGPHILAPAPSRVDAMRAHTRAVLSAVVLLATVTMLVTCAAAGSAEAANFSANQNASMHLGGPNWTTIQSGTRSDRALADPQGITSDGTHIYVADEDMNRIAQWNAFPAANGPVISTVQQKASGVDLFDPTASCAKTGVAFPGDVMIGGGHMAVADTNHNRVLLWNTVPTAPNTPPDVVLGQPNYSSCSSPGFGTTSSTNMDSPGGVWVNATKVVVADTGTNRVLIWNSWPTTDGQAADLVIGQATMNTLAAGGGASGLDSPGGVYADPAGTSLLIADTKNDRILGYSTFPTTNGQAANRVIGQSNLTNVGTACTQSRLNTPQDVWTDGTKVAVADSNNHRVLFFDAWPTGSSGPAADGVIGHGSYGTCAANDNNSTVSSTTMRSPSDVWSDGSKVLVSDEYNNRVLTYGAWPSGTTNTGASFVLGHDTMSKAGILDENRDFVFLHRRFSHDEHGIWPTAIPGGGLFVESTDSNLGMLWTTTPAATNTPYTWRLHQGDDTHTFYKGPTNARTGTSAYDPQGSWSDGTRLLTTDQDNDRILIYNTLPTSDNPMPNAALGQSSLTSSNNGTTQSTLDDPHGVASDGTRVAVSDQNNNRILIWNSIPTTSPSPPADVVLGQPDFTSNLANNGGRSLGSLNSPTGIAIWNGKLLVADTGNNRILVWNSIPTINSTPANAVIGQLSATSGSSGTDTDNVIGVSAAGNAAFFTNDCGSQVLDPIPTSGAVRNASVGIGLTGCITDNVWAQNRDSTSSGISALGGSVWIGEDYGARVARWVDSTSPTISVAPTATVRCDGTVTINFTTSESTISTLYYDSVTRGGVYTSYASNVAESDYTGLAHSIELSFATPGTRYAMVRAVDWNSQAVTSSEISFTVPATCPAPTTMLADDSNAQAGFGRANPSTTNTPPISSLTFHTSWLQSSGVTMDSFQSETWSTPPEHAGGLWHLDNSTAADVNSQSPNAITWSGGPLYTASGRFGQGMSLDGTSQYGTIPHDPLLTKPNDFTVDAWFRATSIAGLANRVLVQKSTSGCVAGCSYSIEARTGPDRINASAWANGAQRNASTSLTPYLDGAWHYVAMTVDSSNNLRLYLDGAPAAGPVAMTSGVDQNTDPITIGAQKSGTGSFWSGDVDEVRFAPIAYDASAILGYYRTQRPHADRVWNSAATPLGANCATAARCTDQVYAGSTGILHDGARYWQRTRFNTLNNDYWSTYGLDWFEVSNTTSISLSAGGTVALGSALPGNDAFGTSTISVTTNSANGYQLYARDEDDTWGLERVGGGPTILDRQDGATPPAAWLSGTAGFFGVTVRDATGGRLAKWGAGTAWPESDTTNNLYTGLEGTTDVLLHQRTTYSSPADTILLTVRANAALSQAAGNYDGIVTLTAIANP